MSDKTEPLVVFTPPASIKAAPDIAIKSSDGELLLAHKARLAAASNVLEGMFSLMEHSGPEVEQERPVVELSEPSDVTLKILLSYIYPATELHPGTFKAFRATLLAAYKYEIQCVIKVLRGYFTWPPFLKSNPLGIYPMSRGLQSSVEMQNALEILYRLEEDQILSEDMDGIPASVLAEVLQGRRSRSGRVVMEMEKMIFRSPYHSPAHQNYRRPSCKVCKELPLWLCRWVDQIKLELLPEKPVIPSTLSFGALETTRLKAPTCPCGKEQLWDPTWFQAFKEHVESQI